MLNHKYDNGCKLHWKNLEIKDPFNLHFFLQGLNILDDFIASNVITHHTMQNSNSIQSDLKYQKKITNPMNN